MVEAPLCHFGPDRRRQSAPELQTSAENRQHLAWSKCFVLSRRHLQQSRFLPHMPLLEHGTEVTFVTAFDLSPICCFESSSFVQVLLRDLLFYPLLLNHDMVAKKH